MFHILINTLRVILLLNILININVTTILFLNPHITHLFIPLPVTYLSANTNLLFSHTPINIHTIFPSNRH